MYFVRSTKSYKISFKKLLKSGRKSDVEKLEKIIDILANEQELSSQYRNHYLTGNLSEFQECHIKDDLLLMYRKFEKELILVLVAVGRHDDLFG